MTPAKSDGPGSGANGANKAGDAGAPGAKPFRCRVSFDRPELVGARWWMEAQMKAAACKTAGGSMDRQTKTVLWAFAALAGIPVVIGVCGATCDTSETETWTTVTQNSLEAQRSRGWDTGNTGNVLAFPGAQTTDATGRPIAADTLASLGSDLAPTRTASRSWYVSTLFQSVELPANTALRQALRPIVSENMTAAFDRGTAVRAMFEEQGAPRDVAIVADLAGPEAVAFAAGLAPHFDPVFVFDNWPHPAGVVPAHHTLAAALYYRGWFADHHASLDAPPAFVLDRNRLAPYTNAPDRFDNRYIARLPGADALKALDVKRILYVVPDAAAGAEMDDLNEPFVALRAAGIDVKILALSDLRPETTTAATDTSTSTAPGTTQGGVARPTTYHYGGHHGGSSWFWHYYAWRATSNLGQVGPAPTVGSGYGYTPTPRPTIFSSVGSNGTTGAAVRPSGFGTTTYRTGSGSSSSSGRSGSFGRSGGSSFSG